MPSTATDRLNGLTTSVAVKAPVQAVTTTNLTLSGIQTVNGVALAEGDRVLVKDQTTASENGIYCASTGSWARAADFDGARDVVDGTLVVSNNDTSIYYRVTTTDPVTIGSSSIVFEIVSGAVTQSSIGQALYPRTDAEIAAGVTPVNYAYPPGHLDRYCANTTPGTTDVTGGMQNWALLGGSHELTAGQGPYKFVSAITFANDGSHIRGSGQRMTYFQFDPASNVTTGFGGSGWGNDGFLFSKGAAVLFNGSLEKIRFTTTNNNQKNFIVLRDVSTFRLSEVEVFTSAQSTSKNSVGIYTQGREIITLANVKIQTDCPFRIGDNPNTTNQLDLDHCCIRDSFLYSITDSGTDVYCIDSDNGVAVTNFCLDGFNTFGHGAGMFRLLNTTANGAPSYAINLGGSWRHESAGTDETSYAIRMDFASTNVCKDVRISGGKMSAERKGIFARNLRFFCVEYTEIDTTTKEILNVDGTVLNMLFSNFITQSGSSATLTGQTLRYEAQKYANTPIPDTAFYSSATSEQFSYGRLGPTIANVSLGGTESASSPDPGNNGTITTASVLVARITPTANETGLILQSGTIPGQIVTVINEAASFSITFAAAGTSHVAGGGAISIAAQRKKTFVWDTTAAVWFSE